MGTHMTLTGLRATFMPYLGMVLYLYSPLGLNTMAIGGGIMLLVALGFSLTSEPADPEVPANLNQ